MTGMPLHLRLVVVAGATAIAVAFCCLGVDAARAEDAAKGEFSDACAMGLASGQTVKTDCSVNWTAPDGKVYCFSTEASKETFLKNADENIQKAREFYVAQDAAPSTDAAPAAAATGPSKEFTEEDVNAAVKKTIDAQDQGRRLRLPRSQARRRSQPHLRQASRSCAA